MQQAKGKIFLAVRDGVMREVLTQALEIRFPGIIKICASPDQAETGESLAVLLTDFDAIGQPPPSLLILRLGGNGMSLPLRLGDMISRIMRHFTRGALQSVVIGPWNLFPGEGRLVLGKDGEKIVRLTEKECDILLLLHRKKGGVAERQELLDSIWGYADGVETHTLETHIYRLRRKIETDPAKPQYLLTEGSGYKLAG